MKKKIFLQAILIALVPLIIKDANNDNLEISYHSFNMIKKAIPSTSNTSIKPIITKVGNNYYFKLNKITVSGKEYTPYLYTIRDDGYYETGIDLTTTAKKIDKSSFEILYKYYPNDENAVSIDSNDLKTEKGSEFSKYTRENISNEGYGLRYSQSGYKLKCSYKIDYWNNDIHSMEYEHKYEYETEYSVSYGGSEYYRQSYPKEELIESESSIKNKYKNFLKGIVKEYYYLKKEYTLDVSNYFNYKEASIQNQKKKVSKNNLYSWEQVVYDGLNSDSSNIETKKYAFSTHDKAKEAVLESYTSIAKANEQISGNFSSTLDASGKYIYSYSDISYIGQKNNIDKVYLFNDDNKYASNQNTDNIYVVKLPGNTYYSAFLKVWGETYLKEVISRYIDSNITFEQCSFNTSLSKRYNEFEEDDVYDNTSLYGTELTLPSNTKTNNDYQYNPFKLTSRYLDSNNTIKSSNQEYTYSSENISNVGFYNIDSDFYGVNKNTKAYVFNTNPEFSISSTNTTLNTKLHSSNTVYDVFKANETKELSFNYFDTCQIDVYKDDQYLETLYNKIDLSASSPVLNPASYTLSTQGRYEFVLSDRLSQSKTWYVNISSSKPEVKINKADNKELELEINSSDGGLRNIDALYIYQQKVIRDENNLNQVKVLDNQNHASEGTYTLNTSISASSKTNKFIFKPITEEDKVYYYNINIVVVDKYSQTTIITYAWNFVNDLGGLNSDEDISSLKSEILTIGDTRELSSKYTYSLNNDNAIIEKNNLIAKKEGEFTLSISDTVGNKKEIAYKVITPFESFVIDSEKEEIISNNQKVETSAKFKLRLPRNATATMNGKPYNDEEISEPGEYLFVISRITIFNDLQKEQICNFKLIIKEASKVDPEIEPSDESDKKEDISLNDKTNIQNDEDTKIETATNIVNPSKKNSKIWVVPVSIGGAITVGLVVFLVIIKTRKASSMKTIK